jgi:hypothetical protein
MWVDGWWIGLTKTTRCKLPGGPFLTCRQIGAPRFELGTSSPPDHSRQLAGFGPDWPEVAQEQGFHVPNSGRWRFPPQGRPQAFGPLVGHEAATVWLPDE